MDILQQINEIVKEFRGEDVNLKIDDNFNELGFDSLDRVELVMELESRFDISFPDDLQIETVKELVDTIEKLTKKYNGNWRTFRRPRRRAKTETIEYEIFCRAVYRSAIFAYKKSGSKEVIYE